MIHLVLRLRSSTVTSEICSIVSFRFIVAFRDAAPVVF
ncbi:hypothetical protein J121_1763 [Qipengyuania citrea LAMA 915]|uniref:Uncharacterized protein n=1 Tax=Qipengyuania citrea LAMA 915 TaxID=1306953 RepID=A0A0L1KHX9_9SPHN|nr:hypothetical protein J121_1763 [Qipengyuania citrea LAMA 915]